MIARELWGQGMVEGKGCADKVLAINKREQKYVRVKDPDKNVTDRELVMAAAIQCFWQFKLATDQSEAARTMIWNKVEVFIEREIKPGDPLGKRLLKQVRRARNKDALASGFLAMWGEIEAFLNVASTKEFWEKNSTTPPWEIVSCLKRDLEALVTGELKDGTQGQSGATGSSDRADGAAGAGTPGQGDELGPGAGGSSGNADEGNGRVEAAEGRAEGPGRQAGGGTPAPEQGGRGTESDYHGQRAGGRKLRSVLNGVLPPGETGEGAGAEAGGHPHT